MAILVLSRVFQMLPVCISRIEWVLFSSSGSSKTSTLRKTHLCPVEDKLDQENMQGGVGVCIKGGLHSVHKFISALKYVRIICIV